MATNERITKSRSGYDSKFDANTPCIGIVKNNKDPERMGRLQVWIKGSNASEHDHSGWIWVSNGSPMAGATNIQELDNNETESFEGTQQSYGFWSVPPDLDNEVIVVFVNGDPADGYWIGCIFHKNMNNMVPGLSSGLSYQQSELEGKNIDNKPARVPLSEYNKFRTDTNFQNQSTITRPFHKPLSNGLAKQGLLGDSERGAGSSSARRESPSRVHGFLSPGGNQIILDDGTEDGDSELIRIRTKSGVQILLSETDGYIYLITKDGKNWIEMSNHGAIDIYSATNINLRSEKNINMRADKDINMEAGRDINIKASGDFPTENSLIGGSIKIDAAKNTLLLRSEKNMMATSITDEINIKASDGIFLDGSDINLKGSTGVRISSALDISLDSKLAIILDSAFVFTQTVPGLPAGTGQTILPSQTLVKADRDLIPLNGIDDFFDTSIDTIVTRLPYHEPWPDHANPTTDQRQNIGTSGGDSLFGGFLGDTISSLVTGSIGDIGEIGKIVTGSIGINPIIPLPLIGTPLEGMVQGIYKGTGFEEVLKDVGDGIIEKIKEPIYELVDTVTSQLPIDQFISSDKVLDFVADFEQFAPKEFLDASGKATIGFGHIIKKGEEFVKKLTEDEAFSLLKVDLEDAAQTVRSVVTKELTQDQFDSLTSFVYNVGGSAFKNSELVKKLNQGNFSEIPNELMRWNKVGGKILNGLTRRRRDEALMFVENTVSI